jgi:hypothetical protein
MTFIYDILNYFFNPLPGATFNYYIPILVLIVLLAVVAVGLKIFIKKNKQDKALRKTLRQFPSRIIYMALLLLLSLACRYANINLLSMRLFFFAVIIWGLYICYQLYTAYKVKYPAMKKLLQDQNVASKYTMKKKHKKRK